jgi:hypothetical protein
LEYQCRGVLSDVSDAASACFNAEIDKGHNEK